jgi:hypothetical protein
MSIKMIGKDMKCLHLQFGYGDIGTGIQWVKHDNGIVSGLMYMGNIATKNNIGESYKEEDKISDTYRAFIQFDMIESLDVVIGQLATLRVEMARLESEAGEDK